MGYKIVRKALEKFQERPAESKRKCLKNLREGIEKKELRPDEFHLGEIFCATVANGPRLYESIMDGQGELQEGVTATDTAAFRYLTTGLFNQVFLEAWENPEFIGQRLVNMSQRTQAPRGRRIPGVARIGSAGVKEGIGELEAYPEVGPAEISILTQPIKKFGFIQKVSREMMVSDPAGGQVMQQIQAGAEAESYKFEVYILKHVLGIINNYTADFVGADTSYSTYGTLPNGISNIVTSNPLGTPDAIQNVKNRAYTQTNPITGDLINTGRIRKIVVPHQLEVVANHYRTAANVERVLLPTDGSTYTYRSMSENPYPRDYEVVTSPLIFNLTSSATTWFAGDFEKDIYFVHFWDKEVVTRGMESEEAFTNDVFFMYKNSRAGVGEFRDLVHIYKNTA